MHSYKIKAVATESDKKTIPIGEVNEIRISINGNLSGKVGIHLFKGGTVVFDVEEIRFTQTSLFG